MPGWIVAERWSQGVDNSTSSTYVIPPPVANPRPNVWAPVSLSFATIGYDAGNVNVTTPNSAGFGGVGAAFGAAAFHWVGSLSGESLSIFNDPVFPITIDFDGDSQLGLVWIVDVMVGSADFSFVTLESSVSGTSISVPLEYSSGPELATYAYVATEDADTVYTPGPGLTKIGADVRGTPDELSLSGMYSPTHNKLPTVTLAPSVAAHMWARLDMASQAWWQGRAPNARMVRT